MSKLYSCKAVEQLMGLYGEKENYKCYALDEGTLGYGLMVLTADGYKPAVVTEVYLNEWSSAHKIRFYDKLPKKYARQIENGDMMEMQILSVKWG